MLGWKKRLMYMYISCLALFISVCYFIIFVGLNADMQFLQPFKLLVSIPTLSVSFIIYRKRVFWQFVFLAACAFMYGTINTGIGLFITDKLLNVNNTLLIESAFTIIVSFFTLPPLLFILKRLCNNSFIKKAVIFWRYFWLLPIFFFGVTMMTNTYLNNIDSDKGVEFVIIRVILYFALLLICFLLEKAVNQIAEAESAKLQAEENARKADFYQRMAHELLTPLTEVSTDIQIAKRHPEKAEERLSESQAVIMGMAEKINTALEESEKGDIK